MSTKKTMSKIYSTASGRTGRLDISAILRRVEKELLKEAKKGKTKAKGGKVKK